MTSKAKELDYCSLCGLCRFNCPVFRVTQKETLSPRGKAILLKKGILDKNIMYACTRCEACEENCPARVEFHFKKQRAKLVERGKETEANKKMISNVRKYGNPFGKPGKGKPKDLYCC